MAMAQAFSVLCTGLLVEFNYDQQVLELQSVKTGPLGRNALLDWNQETLGMVRIGLVDSNGINGDGRSWGPTTWAPGSCSFQR